MHVMADGIRAYRYQYRRYRKEPYLFAGIRYQKHIKVTDMYMYHIFLHRYGRSRPCRSTVHPYPPIEISTGEGDPANFREPSVALVILHCNRTQGSTACRHA